MKYKKIYYHKNNIINNKNYMHKLIIALDELDKLEAKRIVQEICEKNEDNLDKIIFKVNDLLALVWFEGLKEIFSHPKAILMIDWKYHDISNTLSNYLVQLKKSWLSEKVELITLHASNWKEALKNLIKTKKSLWLDRLKILSITLLTSLDSDDSYEIYYSSSKDVVLNMAEIAIESWLDWIVCSSKEANMIKEIYKDDLLVVTPWIRFEEDSKDDQKRVLSPKDAINSWADYIVMWRSILKKKNIQESIEKALREMNKWKYRDLKEFELEKRLNKWTWQEILEYIWVVYYRRDWWKYCRLTSWLISNAYINIAILERYPKVLRKISLDLRKKLIESNIFNENKVEKYVVMWAQMWSVRISSFLAYALWIESSSIYTEKWWEKEKEMLLKRHKIDLKWKKIIISEDIITAWSTIKKMIELVRESWWEVVWITCVWNRSWKEEINSIPIKYCFLPPDFKLYWDKETPKKEKKDFPEIPKWWQISEKPKNEWNKLIRSQINQIKK